MTVRELVNWLEEFDEDAEVVIGMQQTYGTDFAMEIEDVSNENVNLFYEDSEDKFVVITEGSQIGSVSYREEW